MQYTTNFNLKKPEGTDVVNIDDLNYNADIIDTKLGSHNSEIADARGGFDTLRKKLDSYAVNVKDFGAVGDGVTDDTAAIQSAIDYAVQTKNSVYIPPGKYIVSQPLRVNKALDPLNPVVGFSIFGTPCAVPYNSYNMLSIIQASSAFPINESILDFRYTEQTAISYLGIYGIPTANGIEFGERTSMGRMFSQHSVEDCSIHNCYIGIRASNAALLKIRKNNVSNCNYIGIGLMQYAGDSDLEGNYINTNNVDFQGNDLYTGTGLLIAYGSGNTNIRGGKIEWNAKGIMIYGSNGINITGVNFDTNKWVHICIDPVDSGNTDKSSKSINITGNRFLGGGTFRNSSLSIGSSHIQIVTSTNQTAYVNIIGNTMRKAGPNAFDLDPATPVGPSLYAIRAEGNGFINANIVGNDLLDCSNTSTLVASGSNVKIYAIANAHNLPFETYSGGIIVTSAYSGKYNQIYSSAPPTVGTWNVGDIVWNTNPTPGGYVGWICTTAGTPGTWKDFGAIST